MSTGMRILLSGIAGTALGALLAVTAPVPIASAQDEEKLGCQCTDDASGSYKCSLDHTECKAGSESCVVKCTP
jgi:hypothetical protein